METKYEALYRRMKEEQRQMAKISKKIKRDGLDVPSEFQRHRIQVNAMLREIAQVRREMTC